MNRYINQSGGKKTGAWLAALFATTTFAHATPASDERSLEKAAIEDVTPQQKYQSAIREAGGAFRESLRDCDQGSVNDRGACVQRAKATFDRDMQDAKRLLNNIHKP